MHRRLKQQGLHRQTNEWVNTEHKEAIVQINKAMAW